MNSVLKSKNRLAVQDCGKPSSEIAQRLCKMLEKGGIKLNDKDIAPPKNGFTPKKH
jgi:hypothetical protein